MTHAKAINRPKCLWNDSHSQACILFWLCLQMNNAAIKSDVLGSGYHCESICLYCGTCVCLWSQVLPESIRQNVHNSKHNKHSNLLISSSPLGHFWTRNSLIKSGLLDYVFGRESGWKQGPGQNSTTGWAKHTKWTHTKEEITSREKSWKLLTENFFTSASTCADSIFNTSYNLGVHSVQ